MGTLWNLGSVEEEVQTLIPDIPVRLSGTNMYSVIERAISFVERYSNNTIGSVSILQKYQNFRQQIGNNG